jgi:hypothetical protein
MKINRQEALIEYETFDWEEAYGTDTLCPPGHKFEGLPYWVEYMPHHLQQEYISAVDKREFVDTTLYTEKHMIEQYGEEYSKYVKTK